MKYLTVLATAVAMFATSAVYAATADDRAKLDVYAGQLTCAQVRGDVRAYTVAALHYNAVTRKLGYPDTFLASERFTTPPSYVYQAMKEGRFCGL